MGGGWCYSKVDCLGRSKTNLGSSLKWPKTFCAGGMLADDPAINPDFAGFNRVVLAYCDGNSFASNREDPVPVTTTDADGVARTSTIYWRGKRLIDATLATLVEKHKLADAETVMLTGASAGGLAGYLHTDYVHEQLQTLAPKMKKYRSAPISGFFLDHDNVLGVPVYETMLKNLFEESNATGGVNQHCIAATAAADRWKCNFASGSYAHTQAPIFALNSALDAWQTGCIFTATLDPGFPKTTPPVRALLLASCVCHTWYIQKELQFTKTGSGRMDGEFIQKETAFVSTAQNLDEHGNCANAGADFSSAACKGKPRAKCSGPWSKCAGSPEACNSTQIIAMNQYISDFMAAMTQTTTYKKPGNGAFIHSCHTHCEAQTTADWTKFAVNGVTIQVRMTDTPSCV